MPRFITLLAWGVTIALAVVTFLTALQLSLARQQVSNLESQLRLADAALRESRNLREAERLILTRALSEAMGNAPSGAPRSGSAPAP